MQTYNTAPKVISGIISLFIMTATQAATPLWTFTPTSPTTLAVPANGSATVQYIVQNQSHKSKRLLILPMPGITQTSSCQLTPKGQTGSTCVLNLAIDGSALPPRGIKDGPALCQTNPDNTPNPNQCYRPSLPDRLDITQMPVPPMTTLSVSLSSLVLAQQGIFTAASGAGGDITSKARVFHITNLGQAPALDVHWSTNTLPAGTSITPNSCGTIAPGGNCVLTVTPGATPSSAPNTAPIPSIITIEGSNTIAPVTSSIIILAYGNRFQGGFVFAIDDSTPLTASVGGKVAAFMDTADSPRLWGPNAVTGAQSNTNGLSNTEIIAPVVGDYAAKICNDLNSGGFQDWYMPAICEMGYNGGGLDAGCGSSAAPLLQNLFSNLKANGDIGGFTNGLYWSSTEFSGSPTNGAWFQSFNTSVQNAGIKSLDSDEVRCVRFF